jgi:SPP1 family predicted phage head-tail adaptor
MWGYPFQSCKNPLAIPPGAKRYQISIQQKSSTVTGSGSPIASWTTVLTCMSAIKTLMESEAYQTGQFSGHVTHRVSIDWPGVSIGIVAGMQVLFGTRVFTIQGVDNVQERNRVLHLMCLEINGVQ